MADPAGRSIGYDELFQGFDSSLSREIRAEAYGRDIGQHSWVTAEELDEDIVRLRLSGASRLLDLGCGPCGPLTFVVAQVRCHGTGLDLSAGALAAGRARGAELGVGGRVTLHQGDLSATLPFADATFDAVMAIDSIIHVGDRESVLREVARVLAPGGRFLFTDGAVITGCISDSEMGLRAVHGNMHFVVPGFNERMIERAGLRLIESEDRTASLLRNAAGRLAARQARRDALEACEGAAGFERQRRYLETVLELSRRGAVARMMYLAASA
jgi:SAM-dependent methyltransferase